MIPPKARRYGSATTNYRTEKANIVVLENGGKDEPDTVYCGVRNKPEPDVHVTRIVDGLRFPQQDRN